ncbi:hypothetical protein VFPPC_15920 [Pochonia chlamydosporia 170]|uniref:Uncharacterized protein n=1 Tax=Pochonia chlamydosporia 170 TaxID=1380566 RepID=A0A179FV64_METCM|nr:hypothetical protein VFPPC_15920 [Pochonia chlamydosporia 170]OAQ69128.1 hypothetical protein VFPPC_15920 [Pochonia chlamydosporia 170]
MLASRKVLVFHPNSVLYLLYYRFRRCKVSNDYVKLVRLYAIGQDMMQLCISEYLLEQAAKCPSRACIQGLIKHANYSGTPRPYPSCKR